MTTFTTGQILTAAEMNTLAAAALGGTVTSISLAVPGDFVVFGSPVTNAGTITLSHANRTPNTVQAGPASGGSGQPAYRALVAADMPPLGDSMIFQTGRFYTANGITDSGTSFGLFDHRAHDRRADLRSQRDHAANPELPDRGTVSGTAHARMALYADAGGTPGVPVAGADSGDLTQTTAGVLTSAALGVPLVPGWYWPVWESSGLAGGTIEASACWRARTRRGARIRRRRAISANSHALLLTHTYGTALPNPWASTSESAGTVDIPVIALGF